MDQVLQSRREPWRWGEQWPAIGSWQRQLRAISEADPLATTWEVAQELNVNNSMVIWHLKQIGKVKKLDKQVPHELTASPKKSPFFEVLSSLIPHNNNEPFLDWITTCDEKRILYNSWWWAAQWLDREAPKHFSKPNLHQKTSESLFGGLLPFWSITASWIPAKPLHLISMLSKSMRCTENCNAYSRHWSTERAQFSTTSDCTLYNQCFKSWMNWDIKFCLILHWPLANQIPLQASTTFCREKCFHNQQETENAFQELVKFRSTGFSATGVNKLLSLCQVCADCNGSYFD